MGAGLGGVSGYFDKNDDGTRNVERGAKTGAIGSSIQGVCSTIPIQGEIVGALVGSSLSSLFYDIAGGENPFTVENMLETGFAGTMGLIGGVMDAGTPGSNYGMLIAAVSGPVANMTSDYIQELAKKLTTIINKKARLINLATQNTTDTTTGDSSDAKDEKQQ